MIIRVNQVDAYHAISSSFASIVDSFAVFYSTARNDHLVFWVFHNSPLGITQRIYITNAIFWARTFQFFSSFSFPLLIFAYSTGFATALCFTSRTITSHYREILGEASNRHEVHRETDRTRKLHNAIYPKHLFVRVHSIRARSECVGWVPSCRELISSSFHVIKTVINSVIDKHTSHDF